MSSPTWTTRLPDRLIVDPFGEAHLEPGEVVETVVPSFMLADPAVPAPEFYEAPDGSPCGLCRATRSAQEFHLNPADGRYYDQTCVSAIREAQALGWSDPLLVRIMDELNIDVFSHELAAFDLAAPAGYSALTALAWLNLDKLSSDIQSIRAEQARKSQRPSVRVA